MRILDISVPLSDATIRWEGVKAPWAHQEFHRHLNRGDPTTGSWWSLNTHAGTHIDAPSHMVPDGNDVASTDVASYVGTSLVVDVPDLGPEITRAYLEGVADLPGFRRVLFRTANSRHDLWGHDAFEPDYVALAADGAEYLVSLGYRLVGIDYQGIERFDSTEHPTHKTLLRNDCMILEGADLRAVRPGVYQLICLPLRFVNGEGSPVRALLIEGNGTLELLQDRVEPT